MSEITSVLCRLCLKESFTLHNIYSSHTSSGDLVYHVLNYVYDLEITPDDGLLTAICAPCMWKMLEFEGYKRNVHFARVEIVKLLNKLRHASTGGCGSRESDDRPIESDSAQAELPSEDTEPRQGEGEILRDIVDEKQILPGEEPMQEENDLIEDIEDENQVSIKEEMDIVEWEMPAETALKKEPVGLPEGELEGKCNEQAFSQPLQDDNGIESVLHSDPKIITIDRASISSNYILKGMDLELKEEESELTIDAVQSTGSSDLNNDLSLEASEETNDNSFDGVGSSICTSQDMYGKNRDTNKGIPENDLRCDAVLVEKSLSTQISKSILNVTKSGRSNSKAPLSKRKTGFICDICKKSYKQKLHLGRHVRVHYDERPFTCNICDKTFKQDTVRYQHELRHLRYKMSLRESDKGTKKMLYSCDLCELNFNSKQGLYRHSNLHSDKYKCKSCGRCFGDSARLRLHLRTHTKEKPFKCEVCSKCFNQKSNLTSHVHIHSSERPYICDICDKRFKSKGDKTRHELYHLRKE